MHVAIVGGGVIGSSIAWHLVKRGVSKVSLLERDRLGSGTTWHSAGNITWKPIGDNDTQVLYMFETLDELAAAEQHTGWRKTCRLFLARKQETLTIFEAQARATIDRGFASELLTPADAANRLPLISPGSIAGAWFNPLSGRVNPNDLTLAYARAARHRGANIMENCAVSELSFVNNRVTAIETSHGRIPVDAVVVSAGLWSRPLVATFGVALAQMGCEHFYVIASPKPKLSSDMPSFISTDDLIYGREEVGGMLLGCFDEHAKVIDTAELPEPFSFTLLNPDWDKFAPHYQAAIEIFPILENAPIKNFTNGPECFTPDGNPLIGPVQGFTGVFVCTGMNSHGVTLSAAAGDMVADMVLDKVPRFSHVRYAPDRFGDSATDDSWLRARVADAPSGYYRQANVSEEIRLSQS